MKKISIIIALFIVTVSCKGNENKTADSLSVNTSKSDQSSLKRYQVKSGIINYSTKTSGKVVASTITGSGTEVRYFKNWGALELYEQNSTTTTVTKIFGKKTSETTSDHQMTKLDDGTSFIVDFKNKSIIEQKDMAMEMIKKMHPNKDAGEVGKSMLEGLGGKLIGKEKFLGYACEIWNLMGVKQWIYKGVMLKSEANLMGIITITEATKASFDVSVSDSKFDLPNYGIQKTQSSFGLEDLNFEMEDMEDFEADMDKLSKLSFEQWKKMALSDREDEEIQNMSDAELKQTYDMIQKMVKMRKGN